MLAAGTAVGVSPRRGGFAHELMCPEVINLPTIMTLGLKNSVKNEIYKKVVILFELKAAGLGGNRPLANFGLLVLRIFAPMGNTPLVY